MEGVFFAEPANLWPGRDELAELRGDLLKDARPVPDSRLPEQSGAAVPGRVGPLEHPARTGPKSASPVTSSGGAPESEIEAMARIPTHQPPAHPGEVLVEDFLKPIGMTQVQLAHRIRVPFQRVNAIANGRRSITPDTALRLGRLFNTSPDFWLNLQLIRDLYEAAHSEAADVLKKIEPVTARP